MNTETTVGCNWNLTQSPFASVIQTNYVPSIEDLASLEALLAEPQLQLVQLELEVVHVQNLLDTLLLKRDDLKTYVEAHQTLMSPMRRLPEETLSEIFICCLPEDRYAVRSIAKAPLLLTTISREWRRIALATPALWCSLHILLPSGLGIQAVQRRTMSSALWLDRARSLPISISIHVDTPLRFAADGDSSPSEDLLGGLSFLEALIKFNSRIKELTFTGTNFADMLTQVELLSKFNFPVLDTFRVRCTDGHNPFQIQDGAEVSDLPFASLIRQMPTLKRLSVNNFTHCFRRYSELQVDWKNLTELTIQPVISGRVRTMPKFSAREMLNMLMRTPQLQFLTFYITITHWEPVNGNIVVNLPAMRDMRLVFMKQHNLPLDKSFFSNFFCSITCPSLKVLNVLQGWGNIMHTQIPFSSLVSLQQLEVLSLDMPMTPDSLLECLLLVPNLRSLGVRSTAKRVDGDESEGIPPSFSHTIDDSVLLCLGTIGTDRSTLLPHLQHLRFIFKGLHFFPANTFSVDRITDDALFTFLENRIQMKILQSCDIFFLEPRAEPTEENSRRIQALLDSGLKLRIRYGKLPPLKYNDSAFGGLWMERAMGLSESVMTPEGWVGYGEVRSDMEGVHGTGVIV